MDIISKARKELTNEFISFVKRTISEKDLIMLDGDIFFSQNIYDDNRAIDRIRLDNNGNVIFIDSNREDEYPIEEIYAELLEAIYTALEDDWYNVLYDFYEEEDVDE